MVSKLVNLLFQTAGYLQKRGWCAVDVREVYCLFFSTSKKRKNSMKRRNNVVPSPLASRPWDQWSPHCLWRWTPWAPSTTRSSRSSGASAEFGLTGWRLVRLRGVPWGFPESGDGVTKDGSTSAAECCLAGAPVTWGSCQTVYCKCCWLRRCSPITSELIWLLGLEIPFAKIFGPLSIGIWKNHPKSFDGFRDSQPLSDFQNLSEIGRCRMRLKVMYTVHPKNAENGWL